MDDENIYTTEMVYNEQILKKSIVSFWKSSIGWSGIAIIPVMFALVIWFWHEEMVIWFYGVSACLFLYITVIISLYTVFYQRSIQKYRQMDNPKAVFCARGDTFTFESSLGCSTFKWKVVTEIWKYPDFWLFFYGRNQFNILPQKNFSSDMQAFITKQVTQAGGKIKDYRT